MKAQSINDIANFCYVVFSNASQSLDEIFEILPLTDRKLLTVMSADFYLATSATSPFSV